MSRRPLPLLALLVLLLAARAPAQTPASVPASSDSLARGRALFESQCVRCHGFDGSGGAGPSLRRAKLRRAVTDSALAGVIKDGVAATVMPGAWQLTDRELWQVVSYVRSLGQLPPETVPGDSAQGQVLFAGLGGCSACHTIAGKGGSTGPELTEVGALRNATYLRQSLLEPGAAQPVRTLFTYPTGDYAKYLVVRVVTRRGHEIVGHRLNEDPFTIQLRDGRGTLYSFHKEELRVLERREHQSLMPAFGARLTTEQLDDVVRYLTSLRGTP